MKHIWQSKTLWANVLAAVALFAGAQLGYKITAEETAIALAAINAILRAITKEPLTW